MSTLEEFYGIKSNRLPLTQVECLSKLETGQKRILEVFNTPQPASLIKISFPEFTCRCPRTGHPDFANFDLEYVPGQLCVELKALKYYLNSFRDEGHFHEEVTGLIAKDLVDVLKPNLLRLIGEFNVRGGTYPIITCEYSKELGWIY